jgi:iron(III) transport system substrate-binding protein
MMRRLARRVSLVAWLSAVAGSALAQTPASDALVAGALKEGTVKWYTSAELSVVEAIGKAFEAKYPGIKVSIERSGAERNFQRIDQEYSSGIHEADVVDSSDATHFLFWKKAGRLASFVPPTAAYVPARYRDADGTYASWRSTLSVMAYNSKLVPAADAPQSFAALLDAKWTGKLVKAHPGYSGTILTATWEIVRALGWDYFEKLGKQHVMQTQSANDPPRKLALGERPVMVDGVEYTLMREKTRGAPVEPIYPAEGTPFIVGSLGVMKDAPHPNAARLYASYLFSLEAQQLIVDRGGLRSLDPAVKEPAGTKPLSTIKLLADDPASTAEHAAEIKQKYLEDFGI